MAITWYDVLGVPAGASADTLRQAYEGRKGQLRAELLNGAPAPVLSAAARASRSIEAAWLVLSDPAGGASTTRRSGCTRSAGCAAPPTSAVPLAR